MVRIGRPSQAGISVGTNVCRDFCMCKSRIQRIKVISTYVKAERSIVVSIRGGIIIRGGRDLRVE